MIKCLIILSLNHLTNKMLQKVILFIFKDNRIKKTTSLVNLSYFFKTLQQKNDSSNNFIWYQNQLEQQVSRENV